MSSQNTNEEFPETELFWTERAEKYYEQGLITAGEATRRSSVETGSVPSPAETSEQGIPNESILPTSRKVGRTVFIGTRRPRTVREQRSADVRSSGDRPDLYPKLN